MKFKHSWAYDRSYDIKLEKKKFSFFLTGEYPIKECCLILEKRDQLDQSTKIHATKTYKRKLFPCIESFRRKHLAKYTCVTNRTLVEHTLVEQLSVSCICTSYHSLCE